MLLLIRVCGVFTILAFLFSTLSWGHGTPYREPPWIPEASGPMLAHLAAHVLAGALVALPTRRVDLILIAGGCALLIDVDHLGWALGLPMVGRGSHALLFALGAGSVLGGLARLGALGGGQPAVLVGVVAGGAVLAHIALDALGPESSAPLLAPFSYALLPLSTPLGLVAEGFALACTWLAVKIAWPSRLIARRPVLRSMEEEVRVRDYPTLEAAPRRVVQAPQRPPDHTRQGTVEAEGPRTS